MKIGDRVRLLRGKEEGKIVKFLDQGLVEVEIEDGFKIPILQREVVVVADDEAEHFEGKTPSPVKEKGSQGNQNINSQKGVFLAFVEINDKLMSVHIINNTESEVLYAIGEEGQIYRDLQSGKLNPYHAEKITERFVQDFEHWPQLYIQALFFQKGKTIPQEPFSKRIKFKAGSFFRSKRLAPVLSKNAFLFQIDADAKPIDPEALKKSMFLQAEPASDKNAYNAAKPPNEVDLHIEKLVSDHILMNNREILELQINTFEKYLNQAIVSGMDEIIFIHGAGNGVLKNAIHKKLSNTPGIKYFKDARKEKFGYGATLVGISD